MEARTTVASQLRFELQEFALEVVDHRPDGVCAVYVTEDERHYHEDCYDDNNQHDTLLRVEWKVELR